MVFSRDIDHCSKDYFKDHFKDYFKRVSMSRSVREELETVRKENYGE